MARILLAEDEESVRNLVSRGLSQDGHAVTATADGGEALDELVKSGGQFDLLLTDIKMPVMDGLEMAASLAELEPRPLIPPRPLGEGEQYRFHFDMTKCIGCKCCEVACNEQNGEKRRKAMVGHV